MVAPRSAIFIYQCIPEFLNLLVSLQNWLMWEKAGFEVTLSQRFIILIFHTCFMQWCCLLFSVNESSCFSTSGDINNTESVVSIMCLLVVWKKRHTKLWFILSINTGFWIRRNLGTWLSCAERYLPKMPFFPFNHNNFFTLCHKRYTEPSVRFCIGHIIKASVRSCSTKTRRPGTI